MDPNANLAEQVRIAQKILTNPVNDPVDIERLAELVISMNAWIHNGGFLPSAWLQGKA